MVRFVQLSLMLIPLGSVVVLLLVVAGVAEGANPLKQLSSLDPEKVCWSDTPVLVKGEEVPRLISNFAWCFGLAKKQGNLVRMDQLRRRIKESETLLLRSIRNGEADERTAHKFYRLKKNADEFASGLREHRFELRMMELLDQVKPLDRIISRQAISATPLPDLDDPRKPLFIIFPTDEENKVSIHSEDAIETLMEYYVSVTKYLKNRGLSQSALDNFTELYSRWIEEALLRNLDDAETQSYYESLITALNTFEENRFGGEEEEEHNYGGPSPINNKCVSNCKEYPYDNMQMPTSTYGKVLIYAICFLILGLICLMTLCCITGLMGKKSCRFKETTEKEWVEKLDSMHSNTILTLQDQSCIQKQLIKAAEKKLKATGKKCPARVEVLHRLGSYPPKDDESRNTIGRVRKLLGDD